MKDKTHEQLIKELTKLRRRIAELEAIGSKRNEVEESLRTERDHAQQYLDIAEVMLVILDKKGTITLLNRKGSQILGYKEGELIGKNWFTTCLPSHLRKKVNDVFKKLMAGEVKQTEFYANPVLTKSGTERIIAWHNTVLKDRQGNIIGTLSSGEDTTDRKQTEEALRDREERYKTLFDEAVVGICLAYAETGIIFDCNEKMAALVGRERAELIGKSQKILHPPKDDKKLFSPTFRQHLNNKEGLTLETQVITKTGDLREVAIKANLIDLQGRKVMQGMFLDITERKKAEEALHESETRFRTLFEGMPDSVLVHDDEGTILHINEVGAQQLEWSAKDLVGRNLKEIVSAENAVSIADHVKEIQKVGWCKFETTYVSRSGWQIVAEVNEHPIKFGKKKAILSVARDITERKRAEDTLRETTLFLRNLLDSSSSISIISTDLEQNIHFWNKGAENIFGYTAEEMVGHHTVDILYPDEGDTKQTVEGIRSYIVNKKRELRREIKEVTKDGRILWINLTSTPRFDENRNVIGILGIGEDITERKRIEEEKRASEKRYKALFESASDAVYIVNMAGQFIDVNEVACKRLGYRKEELLKMTPKDIDSPEYASLVQKRIKMLRQQGHLLFETVQVRRDGTSIPTELSSRVIEYDGKPAILSIARDITDRKQIEDALRESEERFRRVVETMKVGLGAIDKKGVLTYVNEYLAKMLGYSIDEMIGRSTLDFYDEKSRKIQGEIFKKRKAGMRDPTPYEVTWRRKDGQKVYAILSPTPMFDADGHYTASFAIHTDITERKQMEEALRESEEKYRELINGMNDTAWVIDFNGNFIDVNDAAVEALGYSREELLAMGPHDIDASLDAETINGLIKTMPTDKIQIFETNHTTKDGKLIPVEINSSLVTYQGKQAILSIARDITERKQAEALIEARMRLMEFSATHSLAELLQRTLDEVCEFTKSSVGFYHFVEADQKTLSLQAWSTRTLEEFCTASAEGMHYSIDKAGVWVDCIRERRPVVHNDYASLPHRKGMPEGHASIVRELVVPIMRNDCFVAILGVGNKSQDYTDKDVHIVSYLADVAWEIAERKKAYKSLHEKEEMISAFVETSQDWIWSIDLDGIHTHSNPAVENILGYTPDELIGKSSLTLIHDEDSKSIKAKLPQWIKKKSGWQNLILRWRHKNGQWRWLESNAVPIFDGTGKVIGFRGVDRDITERKQSEEALHRSYQQMQEMLGSTVSALASTVEMKDQYTAGHQPRVTQLACAIAEEMGLAEGQIEGIRMAGLIHDIGKIMVPAEILNKPGPLTDIQYEMIKMHPRASFDILKEIAFPWPVAEIVLQHHERMDGSGYPQGLSGEEIMLEARILAVANVVEAMISHRPYREAHDIKEAFKEISQHKGVLYDPVVVEACLKLFSEKRFTFEQVR